MKVYVVGDTGAGDPDLYIGLPPWSLPTPDVDVVMYLRRGRLRGGMKNEIKRLKPSEILIVEGEQRISLNVQKQLAPLAPVVRLVGGGNRFATEPEVPAPAPSATATPATVAATVASPTPTVTTGATQHATATPATIAAVATVDTPPFIFFDSGFEDGDLTGWRAPSISGDAEALITTTTKHSGTYALELWNYDVDGTHNAGVRMEPNTTDYQPESTPYPDDMYYSGWFYVPVVFEGKSNFFQQKMSDATEWDEYGEPTDHTKRMIWKISLDWDSATDDYFFEVSTRVNQTTGEWEDVQHVQWTSDNPLVSAGEWFHVEVRYIWGQNDTGGTTIWLDGVEVWDQQDYSTEPTNLECFQWCRMFSLNHYLGDWQGAVPPGDSSIIIDDVKFSNYRVGTS